MTTRFTTAARRKQVFELKISGLSHQEICDTLNEARKKKAKDEGKDAPKNIEVLTISHDMRAIMDGLKQETRQLSSDTRNIQLNRLEVAINAIWEGVGKGELDAIHALVRLLERQAKLVGADAPAKIDIEHRIRTMAKEHGFDEDEAVREAEHVYQENKRLITSS